MAGSRCARDARLEQDVGVAEGEVAVELEQEVGGAIAVDVPCHNRVLARLPVAQLAAGSGEVAGAEPGEGLIVRKVLAGIDGLGRCGPDLVGSPGSRRAPRSPAGSRLVR